MLHVYCYLYDYTALESTPCRAMTYKHNTRSSVTHLSGIPCLLSSLYTYLFTYFIGVLPKNIDRPHHVLFLIIISISYDVLLYITAYSFHLNPMVVYYLYKLNRIVT